MISLKQFVVAIHDAILEASDSLRNRNLNLLDLYFEESKTVVDGKKNLVPKSVTLEFHSLTKEGTAAANEVQVPLLTLVPITLSKIEKATLTASFDIEVVDGELQLDFKNRDKSKSVLSGLFGKSSSEKSAGQLEVVITPQDTPEGLKLVVEAYELTVKRQLT